MASHMVQATGVALSGKALANKRLALPTPDRAKQIKLEDFLEQRQQFTPAMERESEQMQASRNQATYARPASGGDRSRFKYVHRELFE